MVLSNLFFNLFLELLYNLGRRWTVIEQKDFYNNYHCRIGNVGSG